MALYRCASGGGGSQYKDGYFNSGSNYNTETIPLDFTPTRVVFWIDNGSSACVTAILDTNNSIDVYFGRNLNGAYLSGTATQSTLPLIQIGTNQITLMGCIGSAFNNQTCYWQAVKE